MTGRGKRHRSGTPCRGRRCESAATPAPSCTPPPPIWSNAGENAKAKALPEPPTALEAQRKALPTAPSWRVQHGVQIRPSGEGDIALILPPPPPSPAGTYRTTCRRCRSRARRASRTLAWRSICSQGDRCVCCHPPAHPVWCRSVHMGSWVFNQRQSLCLVSVHVGPNESTSEEPMQSHRDGRMPKL